MAIKKVFTDESLETFVDEIKSYVDDAVATKANSSHTHSISNITNLQVTLDGKQSTVTGGASTITSSNLTANRALISNSSGKVAVSDITNTELGYLDGVTSSVQTQLNDKVSKAGDVMTGALILQPATGEGGQIQLEASKADKTNNGIVIDTANGDFRIFGIASTDGTSKTGYGTVLMVNPYSAKISGGYTFDGNVIIESKVKLDYDQTNECLNFAFS